jgi:hypothetical protein
MRRAIRFMAKSMGNAEGERWPRFQVELPPEVAEELMQLYRVEMGVNANAATRGGLLRSALLEWWERRDPEPAPAIEGTAVDLPVLELGAGRG